MTTRLLLTLSVLFLAACGGAPEQPPEAPPAPESSSLTVEASFSGWAWKRGGPDSEPSAADLQPFAIRDAEALQAFLARIPQKVPSKRQPAPKNDDALRDAPAPDFATHMLVVCTRDSMYVGPEITELRTVDGTLEVRVEHPPLGDTIHAAAVMDLGRYHAVLVPRIAGEVVGKLVDLPD